MFSTMRKHTLIVSLSGILAGIMAKEVILQNGLNGYDGCVDATISNSGPLDTLIIPDPDILEAWGDKETNYSSLNFLHAHFCPT